MMIALASLFALLLLDAIMDGMRQNSRIPVSARIDLKEAKVARNDNDQHETRPVVAVAGGRRHDAQGGAPTPPKGMDELFASGDWVAGGVEGRISDFKRDEDALVVSYDPDAMADPEITVRTAENGADAEVLLGGELLVVVEGAAGTLRAEDVWLVEEGSTEGS